MEELVKYLKALVGLQAAAHEASEPTIKTELLLARAGLGHREIAEVMGKSYAAVAKTVSRGARAQKGRT